MDILALRQLYDREMRHDIVYHDAIREDSPPVVRHLSLDGDKSFVLHSALDTQTADAEIKAQIAYFSELGHDFEWKLFDYDQPKDLGQRLLAHGFVAEESEAIMVMDLTSPSLLWEEHDVLVTQITEPAGIDDVVAVESAVWQADFTALTKRLRRDLVGQPKLLEIFVAYVDQEPASTGWIYYHEGSSFASLWGGSTLAPARGHGLYTAILAKRTQRARARGFRYVTVDASPASRPILEKQGFVTIAHARGCMWHVENTDR